MPQFVMPGNAAQPSRDRAARRRAGRPRAGSLAATVLGLALLAAAAGCSSGGSGDQKSGGGRAAAAAPTGITVPDKIGFLKKEAEDPEFGTPDDGIPASVRKNLHSVNYADPADNLHHYVSVEGGPGLPITTDGPDDVIQRLFSQWAISANRPKATKVSPGSAGGTAECAPEYSSKDRYDCGWVSGKVALVMSFVGFTLGEAKAQVPKFLDAMVTP
jgi:hypothetical protein